MAEHLTRRLEARAHQHGGPDDAVEPGDVLAHEVEIGRPPRVEERLVAAVSDRRRVVDQGVVPDVDDTRRIEGDGNAPRLPGTADRNVLESALEQPEHLVPSCVGHDEFGMRLVVLPEPIAVRRQAEEMVALLDPLGFPLMDRAQAVDEILLLLERFARHAVPAFVHALVDVARVPRPFEQCLHRAHVAALGRPDEVVEGNVQARPDGTELHLHPVAVCERVEVQLTRFAEDVLRVLVIAHHEADIEPRQPLVAGDDVGGDLLVGRSRDAAGC